MCDLDSKERLLTYFFGVLIRKFGGTPIEWNPHASTWSIVLRSKRPAIFMNIVMLAKNEFFVDYDQLKDQTVSSFQEAVNLAWEWCTTLDYDTVKDEYITNRQRIAAEEQVERMNQRAMHSYDTMSDDDIPF
jgi:glycyl-tRNA synthetase (class II)